MLAFWLRTETDPVRSARALLVSRTDATDTAEQKDDGNDDYENREIEKEQSQLVKASRQSLSSPQQCLSTSQALSSSLHSMFENRLHVCFQHTEQFHKDEIDLDKHYEREKFQVSESCNRSCSFFISLHFLYFHSVNKTCIIAAEAVSSH